MPRKREKSKAVNQIHFVVTEDFAETAELFRQYCQDNSINFSGAVRDAMARWLRERLARESAVSQAAGGESMKALSEMYERSILKEVGNE